MKLKVEIAFTDKYTGDAHKVGDEIEVEKDRGEELLSDSRKLVTLIDEVKRKKKKSE